MKSDVVIVGGGVIGLSVARALALRGGTRVLVLERNTPGAEASHAAGGMLAPQAEADKAGGFMQLACASRDLYPAFAEQLRHETGTDIELEQAGTLYLALNEQDEAEITRRYQWQTAAGLPVQWLKNGEVCQLEPCSSPETRAALFFPRDWQIDNRRLVNALAGSCGRLGVELRANAQVTGLRFSRAGAVEGVELGATSVSAPVVVVASGAWTGLLKTNDMRHPAVHVEPVRGQMLCFQSNPRLARHVIYSPRGYIIPRRDGRLLTGSTTEHAGFDKRLTLEGLHAITTHALEIAPGLRHLPLTEAWAGLRPHAPDGLPVLGPDAEISGLHYATGHYRNGILLAPLTGDLIADAIVSGNVAPALREFGPARFN